jgi:hypothetical protein
MACEWNSFPADGFWGRFYAALVTHKPPEALFPARTPARCKVPPSSSRSKTHTKINTNIELYYVLAALLLLAALLRFQHIVDFVEWPDEIRTVWRASASLENLLTRTPPDWTPTYGLLTWGWVRLAGNTLESARILMVLFGVLATALVYRAALALTRQRDTALLAGVIFAVDGYAIFAGVDVRAYGLLLALGALAFWQTLRWLRKPGWRMSLLLARSLAALFYFSYTSLVYSAYLLLFALVLRPRCLPRLVGVGVLTLVLVLPLLPGFAASAASRLDVMPQPVPPLGEAVLDIYGDYGGTIWFLVPLAAALGLGVVRAARVRGEWRVALLLLLWALAPLAVYFIVNNREFIETRYTWWVLIGLIGLIAYGASILPRLVRRVLIVGFIAAAFVVPLDFSAYRLPETSSPPFRAVLSWFSQQVRPGDVLVIDPYCTCGEPFAWDYFVRQYFPTGYLPIVEQPGDAARVWYLSTTGWQQDEALKADIMDGRAESIFAGPWYFLLRLYEAPPLREGIRFDDRLIFNGVEVADNDTILAKNDRLEVRLWWSAAAPLTADYSTSLAILDSGGRLVAQVDGAPQADQTPTQTSAWTVGTYYEDRRILQLPPDIADGEYTLVVAVYQWWDGVRLQPALHPAFPRRDDGYLELVRLRVTS